MMKALQRCNASSSEILKTTLHKMAKVCKREGGEGFGVGFVTI